MPAVAIDSYSVVFFRSQLATETLSTHDFGLR